MASDDFKITLNTKEFDEAVDVMVSKFPSELRNIVFSGAVVLEGEIIENLNNKILGVRLGRLKASVRAFEPSITGGDIVKAQIFAGGQRVKYARIHEYGGIIRPRNAQYLHFKTDRGNWVRTKQVKMPERRYIRTSIESTKNEIFDTIKGGIVNFLQSQGRCPHCGKAI